LGMFDTVETVSIQPLMPPYLEFLHSLHEL
jgi:hypothetical protein